MFVDSNSNHKRKAVIIMILMISISIYLSGPEIRDGDFAEVKEGQWLGAVVYSTGKGGKAMVQHMFLLSPLIE